VGEDTLKKVENATERLELEGENIPPLATRAVRGGLWVTLSSCWVFGFGFAANIVLTRILPTDAFGGFALAMFFAQLLRLQPKLGLGFAFAHEKETTGDSLGTYFIMESLAALCGVVLTLLAAPVLVYLGYPPLVAQVSVILAIAAFAEGLMWIGGTLLEKELQFTQTTLIQSITFPISYVPAFYLALQGGGIWSLVAQNLTYCVLFSAGVWLAVRKRLPRIWQIRWRFRPELARRFLSFGVTVGLGLFGGMLLTQLDNFFIGTFVSLTVLGFYDRAYRIAQWPSNLLIGAITRSVFYTYTRLQDDAVRLKKTASMVLWLITTLALPLVLAIYVTAPDLIAFLYGDRWLPSALFLRILVIYAVVRPLWDNAGTFFIATGKPKYTLKVVSIQVLVLACTGLPLTLVWGAVGTCVAVGLAFAVGMVLIYRTVALQIPVNLGKEFGIPALVSILTLLGYFALRSLTGLNMLPLATRVAAKGCYAVLAFFTLTLIFQPRATFERVRYIWRLLVL
jgi:O-antigen/teichoic acid export membrane protein